MEKDWMKLDNAAKIYPLVESDFIPSVFRMSAVLTQSVNKDVLLKALNKVITRFPYYKVTLKSGFFWYYLEENNDELKVYEDTEGVCRRIFKADNNGYLFRVLYWDRRVAVEFHHILGDGTACLTFLCTLIHEYLHLSGVDTEVNSWIKDVDSEPAAQEIEDSHSIVGGKHLKTHNQKSDTAKGAFHLKNPLLSPGSYIVTSGIVNGSDLSKLAKSFSASITVFLTSVYLESVLEIQKEQIKNRRKRKPVAIQVPVNMRNWIKSESMRNFSLFIIPYLQGNRDYEFSEIVEAVKTYFESKLDLDYLLSLMVWNLKTERSIFVRLLPLRLKALITPLIYKTVGVDTYSGTISNIGLLRLPETMEAQIERVDFILGPCPLTKCSGAVAGFKDKVYISFGRNTGEALVEQKFFRKLVRLGLKIQIESSDNK